MRATCGGAGGVSASRHTMGSCVLLLSDCFRFLVVFFCPLRVQSIEETFRKIDAMEVLVHTVRRNLSEMQARVDRAEQEHRELNGGGSVRKLLNAIPLFKRSKPAPAAAEPSGSTPAAVVAANVSATQPDGATDAGATAAPPQTAAQAAPVRIHRTSDFFEPARQAAAEL